MNQQPLRPEEIPFEIQSEGQWFGFFSFDAFLFLCFVIGAFKCFSVLSTLIAPYFYKRQNLKKKYGGGWAVVTGGSEGIGEAIAIELAKQGFDIMLVSRNLQKLQLAKQNVQKANSEIKVEIYSIDLSYLTTEQDYVQSFKEIMAKDVSILVNNVGYLVPSKFQDAQFQQLRNEVKLNTLPIAVLTKMFLDHFMGRNKSGIINLSSISATFDVGGAAHYHATKTFDDFFSRTVRSYLPHKLDILTVRPGRVTTPLVGNQTGPNYTTAEATAIQTVNALGNTGIIYGPLVHRKIAVIIQLAHDWFSKEVTQENANLKAAMKKKQ